VPQDNPLGENTSEAGEKGTKEGKLAAELAHLPDQLVVLAQHENVRMDDYATMLHSDYSDKAGGYTKLKTA
jgi:hypothetical protein